MNLGLGVMINMLRDNSDAANALRSSFNKKITKCELVDNVFKIHFEDNTQLHLSDMGQSCCESRYMVCDDNLDSLNGGQLLSVELRDAPEQVGEYGDTHEIQFLLIISTKGVITISNHNEHNGYYGGFYIQAKVV